MLTCMYWLTTMTFISMATNRHNQLQSRFITGVAATFNYMSLVQCRQCEQLSHYMKRFQDGTTKCVPCTKCPRGQCIASHCVGFKDNVCRQPDQNEYIHGHDCTLCSECGTKRTTVRNCSKHFDTQCGDCVPGFKWDSLLFDCVDAP
ncbi:unnamed protein product, partial [Owenia fusiformis]